MLPRDFWQRETHRTYLAKHDFGAVLRIFKEHANRLGCRLTQEEIGFACELPQNSVSDIMRGKRQVTTLEVARRICVALEVPPELLGFGPARATAAAPPEEDVLDFSRRGFLTAVVALSMGSGDGLDVERLLRLLPADPGADLPRRVGVADVNAIEKLTRFFREHDHQHGGGPMRAAAEGQLKSALRLLGTLDQESTPPELRLATADLASVTGWMAYDGEDHKAARTLWAIALASSKDADHPRTADFTAHVYLDLAHQALHVDQPEHALQAVRFAATSAVGLRHPISASTESYIQTNLAWCHAALGPDHEQACLRALGSSLDAWAGADRADTPPWAWDVTDAEIDAQHGHAHYLLSETVPHHAETAVRHLGAAVAGYGPAYARSSAVNLPGLAGSHFRLGNFDAAVQFGHRAVTEIDALSSVRAYKRLEQLDRIAEPHAAQPDVADLRDRIREVLLATAA